MKTLGLIAVLFCTMLLLSSCDGKLEVRDRAFVQGVGIEYDGRYNVRLKLFDDDACYAGEGETFSAAIENAGYENGIDIFTGHTEIIIMSEDKSMELCETLVNEEVSAGCIVFFNDDPILFAEKNDTGKLADVLSSRVRNGSEQKVSVRTIVNSAR
jgi:hypothetical protein